MKLTVNRMLPAERVKKSREMQVGLAMRLRANYHPAQQPRPEKCSICGAHGSGMVMGYPDCH